MSTSAGKTKSVLRASAPPFHLDRRFQLSASATPFHLETPERRFQLSASAKEFHLENSDRPFQLRASAPEFHPNLDLRCLFLTFSNGYSLKGSQIISYFTRLYGPCVEDVFVSRPKKPVGGVRKPALFGKVMFKYPWIAEDVMGIKDRVSIHIDDILVYCKRYVSQTPIAGARRE